MTYRAKVSVVRSSVASGGNVKFDNWNAIPSVFFTAKDDKGNFMLSESDREYIYQKQEETRPCQPTS